MQRFRAGSFSFTAPTSWNEVTLGQFLSLIGPDAPDSAAFTVTTLTGLAESELRNVKGAFDLNAFVLKHLSFINELPVIDEALPRKLTINGNPVTLPEDLGSVATLGQMWDIDLAIRSRQKDNLPVDSISMAQDVLPVFLWPMLRDQPYSDRQTAMELWPTLSDLPCPEALAVSSFFLLNSLSPSDSGKVSVTVLPPIQSKNWLLRARQIWQRLTNSTPLFT